MVRRPTATTENGSALPLRALVAVIAVVLVASACSHLRAPSPEDSSAGEWREFQGTWTATGSRNIIRLEGERRASIAIFDGTLLLAGRSRPGIGFRSEALVFNDSSTGLIGRAVWTDERGDQVFSELQGGDTATNSRITGTFVGGTGRYSGATGTYAFSWRFMLENEDGTVQGQSSGLAGRFRVHSAGAKTDTGGRL